MSGYHRPRYVSDACADWWKRPRGRIDGSLEQGPRLGVRKRHGRFDESLERGSSLGVRKNDQDGQRSSKERCGQVQRIPRERPQLGSSKNGQIGQRSTRKRCGPLVEASGWRESEEPSGNVLCEVLVSRNPMLISSEW